MPRELTAHKVNACNQALSVHAMDGPGPGGASHEYRIQLNGSNYLMVNFQNGPIAEAGTNGITHEVLLAVLLDRLTGFQAGPYACEENESALTHLQRAMDVLHARTSKRLARGVEGTHAV
jgi:hypothetical protein